MNEIKNEYTIEELLEIAQAGESVKAKQTKRDLQDVNAFIQSKNINAGEDVVETDIIYYLYIKWKKRQPKGKRKPIGRTKFFKDFSLYFENKKWRSQGIYYNVYLLDRTTLDIFTNLEQSELFWKAREYYSNEKKKKARKK